MMFSKSLAVRRGIKKGEIIRMEDLETKKPNGYGISANEYKSVIGEVAATDIPENGFINIENIQ